MIAITIGIVAGFCLGLGYSYWKHHKYDGSSLRDLDKYSGRF